MLHEISELFSEFGIEYADAVPFSECTVINRGKMRRIGFEPQTAIVFAVPYLRRFYDDINISLYAVSEDYHIFFSRLFSELLLRLGKMFPDGRFAAFADNSPIDERTAAAKAGLGVIGENGLLINDKYASFVFIGELITDVPPRFIVTRGDFTVYRCEGCGRCTEACPQKGGQCLSALTQKKGELTQSEKEMIKASGCAWGCDICQLVCPHSTTAAMSEIAFFSEKTIARLTRDIISAMNDDEFMRRAYAWRGKKTILRNLELLELPESEVKDTFTV